jgi:hypothetical protein
MVTLWTPDQVRGDTSCQIGFVFHFWIFKWIEPSTVAFAFQAVLFPHFKTTWFGVLPFLYSYIFTYLLYKEFPVFISVGTAHPTCAHPTRLSYSQAGNSGHITVPGSIFWTGLCSSLLCRSRESEWEMRFCCGLGVRRDR